MDHEHNVPFSGGHTGFHRYLFFLRLNLLMTSLYVALALCLGLEGSLEWKHLIPGLKPEVGWILYVTLILPPLIGLWALPTAISALVTVGHVGHMRNKEIIGRVVRLMKTKKALGALKVLAMLRMKTAQTEEVSAIPAPVDTSNITLSLEGQNAIPVIASADHDLWRRSKQDAGWKYGEVHDSSKMTHPDLVPFEQLGEDAQAYNLKAATDMLKVVTALGYMIEREHRTHIHLTVNDIKDDKDARPSTRHLSELLAANAHQSWARSKLESGWQHAPVSNAALKQSHLLVPYEQLPAQEQQDKLATVDRLLDSAVDKGYRFIQIWQTPKASLATTSQTPSSQSLFSTSSRKRAGSQHIRRSELKQAFDLFSKNSGKIINANILPALESLGLTVTKTDAVTIIREMDPENHGAVCFNNFCQWVLERQVAYGDHGRQSVHQIVASAFNIIDRDNSGEITAAELKDALAGMGETIDFDDAQAILQEADR